MEKSSGEKFKVSKSIIAHKFSHFLLITATLLLTCVIGGCFTSGINKRDTVNTQLSASEQSDHENLALQNTIVSTPKLISGVLSNGFRYMLFKNSEPADRVSMHLDVQAGSMQELENQRGLAHFLEHLLFCGSTHFKPGELIKFFQKIGMQFGADANAHTGFYETVYDVLLPNGSEKSLNEGLLVMQDYAQGAFLLQSEVDREQHVVLAEKRDRDSSSYRTFEKSLAFELPDTRIMNRLPIGKEDVIKNADRALLKDYYDTWYRPENMVLVMVGDFDVDLAVSLIDKKFSSFRSRAPKRTVPIDINVSHKGNKAFYHYEAEAGSVSVNIETIKSVPILQDSIALRKKNLICAMANSILRDRLDVLITKPNAPFTSTSVWSGNFLRNLEISQIGAQCSPENWEKSLAVIEQELRRALQYGFTENELKRVKIEYLAELEKAVMTASTRNSQMLAGQIIRAVNNERAFLSPEQENKLLAPFVKSCTLATLHDAFKSVWSNGDNNNQYDHRLIMVTGNVDLKVNKKSAEEKILSVFQKSESTTVLKQKEEQGVKFPYLTAPEKSGVIIKRENIEDQKIVIIDYQNGLRLNLKKTDFKANEVLFTLNFGKGKICEPIDKPGLAILSSRLLNESGFGKLKSVELDRALAGKNTDIYFSVGSNKFSFSGVGVSGEVELIFQLLYTWLNDPAFRQEARNLCIERFRQEYETSLHTIEGAMGLYVNRFLAGGDGRFGIPSLKLFETYTVDDVRNWIIPSLQNAPLELSIVGDFDLNKVVKYASKYIGSLPPRKENKVQCNLNVPVFPDGQLLKVDVPTTIPKARVEVAWPTDDFWNIKQTRRLSVLGRFFSEKLRKRVREKLGAAYSPFAYNRPSIAYKGYGVFQAVVFVSPKDTKTITDEIKQIALHIAQRGVSDEELSLALDPVLTSLKDMVKTNGYWLNSVLSGSKNAPQKIQWSRNIIKDYSAISTEELTSIARFFLNNDKATTVVIRPSKVN